MPRLQFIIFCLALSTTLPAQWGASTTFSNMQALRLDWKTGKSDNTYYFTPSLGTGVYYSFAEKRKNGIPMIRSVGTQLQMINRTTMISNEFTHSVWLRVPIQFMTDVPVRFAEGQKPFMSFHSAGSLLISTPMATEQNLAIELPTKYANLGMGADIGMKFMGPYDVQFKMAYQLAIDFVSLGAKESPSWAKTKFMEQGFGVTMQRSFAGSKDQRAAMKAEKKARKAKRKG
jgi:hypothetical protein